MNRKTNIFYNVNNSNDSKFITFNNYAEALTGDILSVDYKLWPSRFICAYISGLNKKENKEEFIKELTKYYENKLAFLRDTVEDHSKLLPLNYLISFLYYYIYKNISSDSESSSDLESCLKDHYNDENDNENDDNDENNNEIPTVKLNYIGDIVEQDYNGTYTDIICTINPSKWHKPLITFKNDIGNREQYIINSTTLYGWENTNLQAPDILDSIICDNTITVENKSNNIYYVDSIINDISIVDENNNDNDKLKFNIIIPLFNLINVNNANDIDENSSTLELSNSKNIPLGIYFCDDTIELNVNGNFSTNWSLLISTQFSAFPFSYNIMQNFDSSDATKDAYITFAQILAKQTEYVDTLNRYDSLIKTLKNRIDLIESTLTNIGSIKNIDELSQDIINFKNEQLVKYNALENKINDLEEFINNNRLRWNLVKNNNE